MANSRSLDERREEWEILFRGPLPPELAYGATAEQPVGAKSRVKTLTRRALLGLTTRRAA